MERKKTKILIVGIGGVGGYFGGMLAKKYSESDDVEIIFLARNENLKHIKQYGLKVLKGEDEFIARPNLVSDNAKSIGLVNYVLLCTKSYDLESTIEQIKPCLDKNTVILPLQNGVDSFEKIKLILPNAYAIQGCVYIVSRLIDFGIIENSGNIQTLFFGLDHEKDNKLIFLEKLMKDADIEAICSDNISKIVWEKFIFISPTATATTYFNSSIGKLLDENKELLIQLINEVKCLALAKGIKVDDLILDKTLNKLSSLPYNTTSSMHSDFIKNKFHTELESLTGYVIEQGKKININTNTYANIHQKLKNGLTFLD